MSQDSEAMALGSESPLYNVRLAEGHTVTYNGLCVSARHPDGRKQYYGQKEREGKEGTIGHHTADHAKANIFVFDGRVETCCSIEEYPGEYEAETILADRSSTPTDVTTMNLCCHIYDLNEVPSTGYCEVASQQAGDFYIVGGAEWKGVSTLACNEPTFVSGVCERASKSQVCGGPILIVHFIFTGLNARGSVPRVLNTALEEYHSEETLRYLEVFFAFGTRRNLRHWLTEAESLVATIGKDIFQQKISFVSVHSEVTRGDLFAGKDEQGSDVAVTPKEFMEYLFSGGLQLLVHGATVFMLSCGPRVAFSESISSLKEGLLEYDIFCVQWLKPAYTVAFGAKRFISATIKSFIIAFGVRVVIQGHDLGEVFKDLLDVSVELSMHTDAYIFQVKENATSYFQRPK
ncbi:hypothetical protein EDD15DRAFT_2201935 [Pisolithus albus]|nr:hypothetical protein EDD15DRAFT_2201935 [Pisolithus albus]